MSLSTNGLPLWGVLDDYLNYMIHYAGKQEVELVRSSQFAEQQPMGIGRALSCTHLVASLYFLPNREIYAEHRLRCLSMKVHERTLCFKG